MTRKRTAVAVTEDIESANDSDLDNHHSQVLNADLYEVSSQNNTDDNYTSQDSEDNIPKIIKKLVKKSRGKATTKTTTASRKNKVTRSSSKTTGTEDNQGIGDEEQGDYQDDSLPDSGKNKIKITAPSADPLVQSCRSMVPFSPYALCAPKPTWTGRLGYACLNMVLRQQKPPVFCSRTVRLANLKANGIDVAKELGKQNAHDLLKLIQWNEDHGIKFMRVSSELFPFASHDDMGYSLEYAADDLAAVGALAKKYGHRLTSHPGQFTQLGSPNKEVVRRSIADLGYHAQIFDRMQLDQDSVMILHLGGKFEGKKETIQRFEAVFQSQLTPSIRSRLVLENDEIGYTILDLLPTSERLQIPIVVDWHHDSISPSYIEESKSNSTLSSPPSTNPIAEEAKNETSEVTEITARHVPVESLLPRVNAVWHSRGIKIKQHFSEPRGKEGCNLREWRSHSKKCHGFPPTEGDIDIMIEAKHKEQALLYTWWKFNMYGKRALIEQWAKDGEVLALEEDDIGREIPNVVEREKRLLDLKETAKSKKIFEKEQKEMVKQERKNERESKRASKIAVSDNDSDGIARKKLRNINKSVDSSLVLTLPSSQVQLSKVETTSPQAPGRKSRVKASKSSASHEAPHSTPIQPKRRRVAIKSEEIMSNPISDCKTESREMSKPSDDGDSNDTVQHPIMKRASARLKTTKKV